MQAQEAEQQPGAGVGLAREQREAAGLDRQRNAK
jgi:hypothetical protein